MTPLFLPMSYSYLLYDEEALGLSPRRGKEMLVAPSAGLGVTVHSVLLPRD